MGVTVSPMRQSIPDVFTIQKYFQNSRYRLNSIYIFVCKVANTYKCHTCTYIQIFLTLYTNMKLIKITSYKRFLNLFEYATSRTIFSLT